MYSREYWMRCTGMCPCTYEFEQETHFGWGAVPNQPVLKMAKPAMYEYETDTLSFSHLQPGGCRS